MTCEKCKAEIARVLRSLWCKGSHYVVHQDKDTIKAFEGGWDCCILQLIDKLGISSNSPSDTNSEVNR